MVQISNDQVVKLNNRMADIREELSWLDDTNQFNMPRFIMAIGELLGTLDAVLFDERSYADDSTR